jgi:hypothetical protein
MSAERTMGGGEFPVRICRTCGYYNLGKCMFWERFCSARGKACNRWKPKDAA